MKFITLFTLCFIAACTTTAVTDAPSMFAGYEKYHLNTRHDSWVLTSPLPGDKTYTELNEDQQKIVKGYYSKLVENDSPPFPASGTKTLYKAFIKEQHRAAVRTYSRVFGVSRGYTRSFDVGNFVAIATINKSGKTEKVEILESPSNRLKRGISKILFSTKFDPGSCNGELCQKEFFFQIFTKGSSFRGGAKETYTVYPPKKDSQNQQNQLDLNTF